MLDFQEYINNKVKKHLPLSAGFAGGKGRGFGNLSIDIFLEVRNKNIVKYCI